MLRIKTRTESKMDRLKKRKEWTVKTSATQKKRVRLESHQRWEVARGGGDVKPKMEIEEAKEILGGEEEKMGRGVRDGKEGKGEIESRLGLGGDKRRAKGVSHLSRMPKPTFSEPAWGGVVLTSTELAPTQ